MLILRDLGAQRCRGLKGFAVYAEAAVVVEVKGVGVIASFRRNCNEAEGLFSDNVDGYGGRASRPDRLNCCSKAEPRPELTRHDLRGELISLSRT